MTQRQGWVYFILAHQAGRLKIGFASNLERRLSEIQSTSPERLDLLHSFEGSVALERVLHHLLSPWRQHNEWFEYGRLPRELVSLAARSGPDCIGKFRDLLTREGIILPPRRKRSDPAKPPILRHKDRIRHFLFVSGRWRWRPTKTMRAAGFQLVTFGSEITPEAVNRAMQLNAEWDAARWRARLGRTNHAHDVS